MKTTNVLRARDTGWEGDRFEDEHGNQWRYFCDGECGDVAVNRCDDDGTVNGYGAGVFEWDEDAEGEGLIRVLPEGGTFGVNCTDEFIVRGGEWRDNDSTDGPIVDTEDSTYGIP